MKRTLAIALSTIALAAASSVSAQTPSFVDYPLVEANVPTRADANSGEKVALPQPSFVDYVAIEPSSVASSGGLQLAGQDLPKPSFADYPLHERSAATHVASERDNVSRAPQTSSAN
jgi:hypothetical protein